jgi:hypothetical protein
MKRTGKDMANIASDSQENSFRKELSDLINRHSIEDESDTPDYILAEYLHQCLKAFNALMKTRDQWYATKWPICLMCLKMRSNLNMIDP